MIESYNPLKIKETVCIKFQVHRSGENSSRVIPMLVTPDGESVYRYEPVIVKDGDSVTIGPFTTDIELALA